MTDPGEIAHQVAIDHITRLEDAFDEEQESDAEIDWGALGAAAPFDGCLDCVAREILHAGVGSLLEQGTLRVVD